MSEIHIIHTNLLPAAKKLRQGNTFTPVCHSGHGGGRLPHGMLRYTPPGPKADTPFDQRQTTPQVRHPPGQTLPLQVRHPPGQIPLPQVRHPQVRHPQIRHPQVRQSPMSDTFPGSYWNASFSSFCF